MAKAKRNRHELEDGKSLKIVGMVVEDGPSSGNFGSSQPWYLNCCQTMDLESKKEKVFLFSVVQGIFIYPLVAHLRRSEGAYFCSECCLYGCG
jgi:hypothetical protein